MSKAVDPSALAEDLIETLTERKGAVFNRVVIIDVQITLAGQRQ